MLKNAYQLLNLSKTATEDEIEAAFVRKAELHHPDHGGDLESFLNLQQAKNLLLNEEMRIELGERALFRPLPIRVTDAFEREVAQLIENLERLAVAYNQRGRVSLQDQNPKGLLLRRVA